MQKIVYGDRYHRDMSETIHDMIARFGDVKKDPTSSDYMSGKLGIWSEDFEAIAIRVFYSICMSYDFNSPEFQKLQEACRQACKEGG